MRTLRASLGWLLAAVLLPLLVAGAASLAHEWTQQREVALERLQDRARTLRRAVDRELALDQAVLRTLAGSRDIDRGEWATFHALAKQASEVRAGSWFVLVDPSWRNLVNTSVPYGTRLPDFRALRSSRADVEWRGRKIPLPDRGVFASVETGAPAFSDLFFGPVIARPVVASTVPVLRDGKARYALSLAYTADAFAALLEAERMPDGITAAVIDGRGLLVARNRRQDDFVGDHAAAPFGAGTGGLPAEGVGETRTVEGVPSFYAYSRSALNGWAIAVAMPRQVVLAPARRALWIGFAVLASAALAGCVLAVRLWRRVAIPLDALAHQARGLGDLGRGVPPTDLEEVEALRLALEEAAAGEHRRRETEREREQARLELRLANARLVEADRRKDEFLGMLSHELRNPLAPIRNSIFVLRRAPPGSEPARRAQGVIERQTEHLTRLVDELLDVTRIARGKIELRRARTDLRELVPRIGEDFRHVLGERGVELDVAVTDAEAWADADATRLTQALGNLLHNASKFTRAGDRVSLTVRVHGADVEIAVRDTGAGIDPALLPHLFDAFVQGARTLARSEGGLGLGLALVKGIAELHGGSVAADSAGPGEGATFTLRLPLDPAEPDRRIA